MGHSPSATSPSAVHFPESLLTDLEPRIVPLSGNRLRSLRFRNDDTSDQPGPNRNQYLDATWIELLRQDVPMHLVGAEVLDYCLGNYSSRAFVFFSLDESKLSSILSMLASEPDLRVFFAAQLELSELGAQNLIELCYGSKAFFDDRARTRMTRERFVFSNHATIVAFSWDVPQSDIVRLKSDLRHVLPDLSFERRIHGTDGREDTEDLLAAICNPNTLELVNRVKLSRRDRVFSRVPENFRRNPRVCVDGSSIMELYGLRKSRDLDLICDDASTIKQILATGYDVNNSHYSWLPLKAQQVVNDPYLHVQLYGVKFTSLAVRQLVIGFGPRLQGAALNPKKLRDAQLISAFNSGSSPRRLSATGMTGTLFTQLRLLMEFAIVRVVPHLPSKFVDFLRRTRSRLTKS
jgi:hypothetical protein